MSFSLIVPIAADRPEWNDTMPYMFDIHPLGNLMAYESIKGLKLKRYDCIYVSILRKHEKRFGLKVMLENQFDIEGLAEKLRVVILENPTRNQPETIAKTIELEKIAGAILVKDADNSFDCQPIEENAVGIFPLDALERVNPADKSYVALDDSMYITNIIEKKIIGRFFCAGAYGFESAELFMRYYSRLARYEKLYLSHLIYAMLLDQITFRPFTVRNYLDWGTYKEWMEYCLEFRTLFIKWNLIDGGNNAQLIKKTNALYETGLNKIVLVVENNLLQEKNIVQAIRQSGLQFHDIIKGSFPRNMQLITSADQLLNME